MSDVAIRAEGLGKQYRFGAQAPQQNLREALTRIGGAPFRAASRLWPGRRPTPATGGRKKGALFWALKGVSFEVRQGEVVGIIGRNGAGKSTLLKVISQITEPSAGQVEIFGRVASLLEVGTGFHPELTGRENVFLNGAILGMTRAEIRRKFDEIIAFAEVEKFIDTAVKFYSSGMYMRLGFAVAAHMEPDILIVDEVLAVGDMKFQRKCLEKMSTVATRGITVLLVSHNLGVIGRIASRVMLLERGRLTAVGAPAEVLDRYNASFLELDDISGHNLENRLARTNGKVQFASVRVLDEAGNPTFALRRDQPILFEVALTRNAPVEGLNLLLYLLSATGTVVASLRLALDDHPQWSRQTFTFRVDANQVKSGEYRLYLALGNRELESFYDVLDSNVGLPPLTVLPPQGLTREDDAYINLKGQVTR